MLEPPAPEGRYLSYGNPGSAPEVNLNFTTLIYTTLPNLTEQGSRRKTRMLILLMVLNTDTRFISCLFVHSR